MSTNTNLASLLASFAGVVPEGSKSASLLIRDDEPARNLDLQSIMGDPEDTAISTFSQFRPNPGSTQLPNPLSPIQGDEIFFTYMMSGAVFQAHDGSQWMIDEYDWDGRVEITNRWYPRLTAQVSVNDVRNAIAAWIEPIQQVVPPPPPGATYGAQLVRVVK